jgi:hypothetical protein
MDDGSDSADVQNGTDGQSRLALKVGSSSHDWDISPTKAILFVSAAEVHVSPNITSGAASG